MLIKIILLAAFAAVAFLGLRGTQGAKHAALRRVGFLLFAVVSGASILFPDVWNAAAELVGVGRGTDLLLYGLIVLVLVLAQSSYLRYRRLEADITRLARRLALDEAESRQGIAPQPYHSDGPR